MNMHKVLDDGIPEIESRLYTLIAKGKVGHLESVLTLLSQALGCFWVIPMNDRKCMIFPVEIIQHQPCVLLHVEVDIPLQYICTMDNKLVVFLLGVLLTL